MGGPTLRSIVGRFQPRRPPFIVLFLHVSSLVCLTVHLQYSVTNPHRSDVFLIRLPLAFLWFGLGCLRSAGALEGGRRLQESCGGGSGCPQRS